MRKRLGIFWAGCIVSFLGSLPLGTMNLAAIHITIKDGAGSAAVYSVGSLLAELVYVRLVLVAMLWVSRQYKLFRVLEWITIFIILVLSVSSFIAARTPAVSMSFSEHVPNPFLWGLFISAVNPLHIVFWLGWSTLLVNKNILIPSAVSYRLYMIGIAIGTLAGFAVFIIGADYFSAQLKAGQQVVNYIIGSVLLITALIQLYKTRAKPAAILYKQAD